MNNILAIETATSACSVALRIDGVIVARHQIGSNIHSRVLMSMVASILSEASLSPSQLNAVAVGQGPGSFTGLRIGVGVAQGLAYGANCSMIGVSSLDALALQSHVDGIILAGIDARMGEVYWCEYRKSNGKISRQCDLTVSAAADIKLSGAAFKVSLVGNAWPDCHESMMKELSGIAQIEESISHPSAEAVLLLAETRFNTGGLISPIDFTPIYVRDDVAKKSTKSVF